MSDGASRETHEKIMKETFLPKYRKKKSKTTTKDVVDKPKNDKK